MVIAPCSEAIGGGVSRINLDGTVEQSQRPTITFIVSPKLCQRAEVKVVGVEALRRLALHPFHLRVAQLGLDDAYDARGNLVLQVENVVQRTVDPIGPQMRAGRSFDQLTGYTYPPTCLTHASL